MTVVTTRVDPLRQTGRTTVMLREVLACCTGAHGQPKILLVLGGSITHARELCQRFQRLVESEGSVAGIERATILRVDFVNGCEVLFKSVQEAPENSLGLNINQSFTDHDAWRMADKNNHPWRFRGSKPRK